MIDEYDRRIWGLPVLLPNLSQRYSAEAITGGRNEESRTLVKQRRV